MNTGTKPSPEEMRSTGGRIIGRTILVVEDSRTQAEYLAHILSEQGYEVTLAANGREALARIREKKPAVVLTDIIMPEMDGYELCREIKTNPDTAGLVVILVTQLFDAEDVLRGLEAGADNFIIKPYDPGQIYSRIEAAFSAESKPDPDDKQVPMEYVFAGRSHRITSDRSGILDILLSTYEYAVKKNIELQEAQETLSATNEELTATMEELTASMEELHTANRNLSAENEERHRVERALADANNKLNLMTSITRHDINNQILALQGYIDLSEVKTGDPVLLEYIRKSRTAVETIRKQIEFTKTYDAIGGCIPQWQDLGTILEPSRQQLREAGIDLETKDIAFQVYADTLLSKVFENLFDNSIRHGNRVHRISVSSALKENGSMCIEYGDDGDGVAGSDKERIFSKGYGKNTGLGLFLSRVILGITGISIRETGVPGEGARFEITVPAGGFRQTGI
jgi:DNA-binding response OmpR family regulator